MIVTGNKLFQSSPIALGNSEIMKIQLGETILWALSKLCDPCSEHLDKSGLPHADCIGESN